MADVDFYGWACFIDFCVERCSANIPYFSRACNIKKSKIWLWLVVGENKKMSINFRNGTEENAHFSICLFGDLLVRRRIVKNVYFSIFLFGDLLVRRRIVKMYILVLFLFVDLSVRRGVILYCNI